MAVRFRRSGLNVGRVATKIVATILALYVGGYLITIVSSVMLGTCSPFYKGLSLFGWKVGARATANATIADATILTECQSSSNILYDVSSAGILVIVGLVGVASIVMEFIEFKM